ncbi:hypothetical protein Cme02nite_12800 [Catellatospora methionotrophica]|uniref:Zinc finger DksA/TraR C4-type domain-containing protein n=2 Tax=Catellatospora methionotrophica TaxID=121620 RepID=A0A8J3PE32_9ACTN|nr:hypothetical protein Cme02nite_12800 [Catellatospora methionotrophica]
MSRAPVLHLGDAMAERAGGSKTGAAAKKAVAKTTAAPKRSVKTVAAGAATAKGETVTATSDSTTAKRAAKTAAPVRKAAAKPAAAAADAKKSARATTTATRRPAAGTEENPPAQATPSAATTAAEGATMVKPAESKTASRTGAKATAAKKGDRSAAETEKIRVALTARRDELQEEYDHTLVEIAELQRDRLTDSAGDDQADTGTKTFEREQEITLANNILERITQVERALERLDEGSYGWCEKCGNPIPVERLAAFPSATLCVTCKQLEERR